MMLRMPGGAPASANNSASIIAAPGTLSDGFIITALPHATERGKDQRGIMAGKLKGQIVAVTPIGKRYEIVSMSVAMFGMLSPSRSDGIAAQFSTTSEIQAVINSTVSFVRDFWVSDIEMFTHEDLGERHPLRRSWSSHFPRRCFQLYFSVII